ncbi:K(+)-transporting ATPase subunit F [Streptomyces sp. NPDC047980]
MEVENVVGLVVALALLGWLVTALIRSLRRPLGSTSS